MQIQEAIKNIREKKLEQMKENFNSAITSKAVEKLEEKKIESIAIESKYIEIPQASTTVLSFEDFKIL